MHLRIVAVVIVVLQLATCGTPTRHASPLIGRTAVLSAVTVPPASRATAAV
jgi:hypothetical protein